MHNNLQTVDNGRALRVLVVTLGLTECSDVMKGASEDHFDISISLGSIYDQTVGASMVRRHTIQRVWGADILLTWSGVPDLTLLVRWMASRFCTSTVTQT